MYTGADIKNLCRESAMIALRRNRDISDVVNINTLLFIYRQLFIYLLKNYKL